MQTNKKEKKSTHEWTVEWIQKFLSFESQLKDLRRKVGSLEKKSSLLNELEELQYLDFKLRYNIRLHEMNLTRFIKDDNRDLNSKSEYRDHKELELAIEHYEQRLTSFKQKIISI